MLTIINDYARSPYTGLIAVITPEVKGEPLSGIQLTITHEGQVIRQLAVDDKGVVDFPLLPDEMAKKAKLEINRPKGAISLELSAGIKPIREHKVSYTEVMDVLDDLEAVASELIGIPGWLIPDVDYIEFVFNSPASMTLQNKNFTKVYLTTSDLKIQLERNDDLRVSNTELVFSALPEHTNIVK